MPAQIAPQPMQRPIQLMQPVQASAPASPFVWGQGGQAVTPQQLQRQQAFAQAIAQSGQNPQNMWQGIQNASGQILGALIGKKADTAEADQQERVRQAILAAAQGDDPNAFLPIEADPFASQGQVAVADAMRTQAMSRGNAGLIQDPDLRAAVQAGKLPFETAVTMDKASAKNVDDMWQPLSDADAKAAGLPSGAGYQVNGNGKIQAIGNGSGVTVNNVSGENAYDKAINEKLATTYSTIQDDAANATQTLGTLGQMTQAMQDPGFYSGAYGDTVLQLKRIGQAIGIDPEGISSTEQFNALSKDAALKAMGGSLGTGFSNADRDFVESQVPNLGNTPAGNAKLVEIQSAIAQRKIDISALADQYATEHNGRLDAHWGQYLAKWAEAHPMFPPISSTGVTDMGNGITIQEMP